jgi:hypothetical protein
VARYDGLSVICQSRPITRDNSASFQRSAPLPTAVVRVSVAATCSTAIIWRARRDSNAGPPA